MTIRQVALVGFSPFETMTLESFFKLAGRRAPGYLIVPDRKAANVWLVNGDTAGRVRELFDEQASAEVILIGPEAFGTPWTVMARPIRLLAVLDMIEQRMLAASAPVVLATPMATTPPQARPPNLEPTGAPLSAPALVPVTAVAARPVQAATMAASPPPTSAPLPQPPYAASPKAASLNTRSQGQVDEFDDSPAFAATDFQQTGEFAPAAPLPPAAPAAVASADFFKSFAPPAATAAPVARAPSHGGLMSFGNSVAPGGAALPSSSAAANDDDLILVVDDSDIVLRFMQGRLQRFGYSVELASTGEDAVTMTQSKSYRFVFLDVMMPGIDGYQTCRLIKKQSHAGKAAPVIVMLSSRGGSIDKIRGTLAGASAYLTKPLVEAALIKVLADHDAETENNFSHTRPVSALSI